MAKKRFRLLEQAPVDWPKQADGVTPLDRGIEFDDDFGYDTEKALVAAGWVEVIEPKEEAKGGKK